MKNITLIVLSSLSIFEAPKAFGADDSRRYEETQPVSQLSALADYILKFYNNEIGFGYGNPRLKALDWHFQRFSNLIAFLPSEQREALKQKIKTNNRMNNNMGKYTPKGMVEKFEDYLDKVFNSPLHIIEFQHLDEELFIKILSYVYNWPKFNLIKHHLPYQTKEAEQQDMDRILKELEEMIGSRSMQVLDTTLRATQKFVEISSSSSRYSPRKPVDQLAERLIETWNKVHKKELSVAEKSVKRIRQMPPPLWPTIEFEDEMAFETKERKLPPPLWPTTEFEDEMAFGTEERNRLFAAIEAFGEGESRRYEETQPVTQLSALADYIFNFYHSEIGFGYGNPRLESLDWHFKRFYNLIAFLPSEQREALKERIKSFNMLNATLNTSRGMVEKFEDYLDKVFNSPLHIIEFQHLDEELFIKILSYVYNWPKFNLIKHHLPYQTKEAEQQDMDRILKELEEMIGSRSMQVLDTTLRATQKFVEISSSSSRYSPRKPVDQLAERLIETWNKVHKKELSVAEKSVHETTIPAATDVHRPKIQPVPKPRRPLPQPKKRIHEMPPPPPPRTDLEENVMLDRPLPPIPVEVPPPPPPRTDLDSEAEVATPVQSAQADVPPPPRRNVGGQFGYRRGAAITDADALAHIRRAMVDSSASLEEEEEEEVTGFETPQEQSLDDQISALKAKIAQDEKKRSLLHQHTPKYRDMGRAIDQNKAKLKDLERQQSALNRPPLPPRDHSPVQPEENPGSTTAAQKMLERAMEKSSDLDSSFVQDFEE